MALAAAVVPGAARAAREVTGARPLATRATISIETPKIETAPFAPTWELPDLSQALALRFADEAEFASQPSEPSVSAADLPAAFIGFVQEFETMLAARADIPAKIETAGALLRAGRTGEGIALLRELETTHGGSFETATALAFALEREGNYDEALLWLARSLERAAPTQRETQWLHVSILQARMRPHDDPVRFDGGTLLKRGDDRALADVLRAIEEQLRGRLRYFSPPDPVIAELFGAAAARLVNPAAAEQRAQYMDQARRFSTDTAVLPTANR